MPNLSRITNMVRVLTSQAAGVGNVNCTHVNMQGFDGVLFILQVGALTATQQTGLKVQGGNLSNDSDQADLALTQNGITFLDSDSGHCIVVDVYRPAYQYVRAVVLRATANAAIDSVLAIQYQGDKFAVGQPNGPALDPTVHAINVVASPAYGTA